MAGHADQRDEGEAAHLIVTSFAIEIGAPFQDIKNNSMLKSVGNLSRLQLLQRFAGRLLE
jgi:hypothetical protein